MQNDLLQFVFAFFSVNFPNCLWCVQELYTILEYTVPVSENSKTSVKRGNTDATVILRRKRVLIQQGNCAGIL